MKDGAVRDLSSRVAYCRREFAEGAASISELTIPGQGYSGKEAVNGHM